MFSLILASHPQAASLLLLPLIASAGHTDHSFKRMHQTAATQIVSAAPMLYPVDVVTCSFRTGSDGKAGDRYVIVPGSFID